jgi:uncharacterized protein YggU (UPF0235/DUF167 family)
MRIFVKAKPGAKKESVQRMERPVEGLFPAAGNAAAVPGWVAKSAVAEKLRLVVAVKERPTGGQANRAIERAIAEYLHVAPSRVRIVAGHASREKIVEVEE